MELTLSDVGAVNISQVIGDGTSVNCDWRGWSMEFDNLTIVRYLMSWNDQLTRRQEDFMDPEKQ